MNSVLSVGQLNRFVKALLEGDARLQDVFVTGEISNFKRHSSGHFYFTLKDADAAVAAVMFRGSNLRLAFLPRDGMRVLARGRVSIYDKSGQYQFYAEDMQPDGLGALFAAFEQRKERLAAEGLFDAARKRPLPFCPARVGVVTSPTGAAVRDILQVLGRRFPAAAVVFCPVLVQGAGAAAEIAAAIRRMNEQRAADVLIVGRGGGSLEDLWAFNEEIVARAVADSEIPVISAVGHETDVTICDFAADLRAPTPSAAAELAVPDTRELLEYLAGEARRRTAALERELRQRRAALEQLTAQRVLRRPEGLLDPARQRLDATRERMESCAAALLRDRRRALAAALARLEALSPLAVLARGYAVARKDGRALRRAAEAVPGDELDVLLQDGRLRCAVLAANDTAT
ncbi:MAG: exodeoxyribonuclease VII large subunit [Oscillospiraceae bacterium]|jgi:exodeoxyribonuclease VII large subunit|nr:exodeoxyribonuclease VII large subunit [Oscillospiraceae bacterium]